MNQPQTVLAAQPAFLEKLFQWRSLVVVEKAGAALSGPARGPGRLRVLSVPHSKSSLYGCVYMQYGCGALNDLTPRFTARAVQGAVPCRRHGRGRGRQRHRAAALRHQRHPRPVLLDGDIKVICAPPCIFRMRITQEIYRAMCENDFNVYA